MQRFVTALAALLIAGSGTAMAQGMGQGMGQQQGQGGGAAQEAQKKVMELGQRLNQIEQKAIEANPELQEQREEFQDLLMETMKEQGAEPQKRIDRLEEIQPKLSEAQGEERRNLMQEFRQEQQSLMQAQRKAMQQEEVKQARQDLQENTFNAMKEENPETEQIIEDLRSAQQEAMNARGGMSGGGNRGGGMPGSGQQ
ncbi:hypothetical protein SAMN05660831_01774 [Thiohalospira halophila DSM 15071]|uniref:LTXXQ motif family protein n=1 Tax=Thiohalospira halophila DSM 15071 TaxID=1123397 RepID=A0A1I1SRZ7_9GAMM|nr:hypothetical protein [Thiohalospira halophila]SFD49186.1 hypothetical protein SAMN05660831_01774 [Thiohalospira halophila DSM 15071]